MQLYARTHVQRSRSMFCCTTVVDASAKTAATDKIQLLDPYILPTNMFVHANTLAVVMPRHCIIDRKSYF